MTDLSLVRRMIPESVTQAAGRLALKASKNSPHILFGIGIVGFGATVVASSRATLQVEDILTDAEKSLEDIRQVSENQDLVKKHGYTADQQLQDRITVYARTTYRLGKLYLPTIGFGVVTVVCLTKSHKILTERNAALTAAYVGLDKAFSAYRDRVRDRLGEDEERNLYYDAQPVEAVENGTGKTVVTDQKKIGPDGYSTRARWFDQSCNNWKPVEEYNYIFLRAQQEFMNNLLRSRGHLFLNEVYDALGFERSREGAMVGWVYKPGNNNYVDFGFMNGDTPARRDFVNGHENSVLLDFNVDSGVVFDYI